MNLPNEFIERARKFTGNDFEEFIASLSRPAPVSIRFNPFKPTAEFISEEKIPWSSEGRYLSHRPSFTLDPLFHAGCYYVQEASSQFLEQPFLQIRRNRNTPLRVLDLCAAPGGKSTHLLSMMNDDDLLISNEIIPSRNSILRYNTIKWGCPNVIVTQNEPSDFEKVKSFFDVVVVDAPCSGEGLFRKDTEAIGEWSMENVLNCSRRQKDILKHIVTAIKPGGYLIYSTCTFEEMENDEQVQMMIDDFGMEVISIENRSTEVLPTKFGLSFFPHRIKGEGFYISILQKQSDEQLNPGISKIRNSKNNFQHYLNQYLTNAEKFSSLKKDERIFAIPQVHLNAYNYLSERLYIRQAGINLGEVKGNDFIPSEMLALSNCISREIHSVSLTHNEAIDFLRGASPKLNSPKGWNVVSYDGHPLGWIKNVGSRINNYYPKPWRIMKL